MSYLNSIKINNLQHQMKSLQSEVDALQLASGSTGISGDLNLNGHNLTNISTLQMKGLDSSINPIGLDASENLTFDNSIVLTNSNYSSYINGTWVGVRHRHYVP